MKFLLSIGFFAILLFCSINSTASSINPVLGKKVSVVKPIKVNLEFYYFWILSTDNCYHLARLNPPGYTDAQGNYWSGLSITFMNEMNYAGTSTMCPPSGEAYC